MKGKIIIVVAPSGTGKTTLIQKLRNDFSQLKWSVSCTTREMRSGEKDGENYFFISEKEFQEKIRRDEFVEWAKVHSHYYGTLKTFIRDGLEQGSFLLFDVDIQGADALKFFFPDSAKAIYIAPPSLQTLEQRLRKRGTDSENVILERLQNAKRELLRKNDYDYLIINDVLEVAYQQLSQIVAQILKG